MVYFKLQIVKNRKKEKIKMKNMIIPETLATVERENERARELYFIKHQKKL